MMTGKPQISPVAQVIMKTGVSRDTAQALDGLAGVALTAGSSAVGSLTRIAGSAGLESVDAFSLGARSAAEFDAAAPIFDVPSANLTLGEMERIPVFGPRSLSAAEAPRYLPGYGWTDAQYWRMVKQLQAGESLEVPNLRLAAELRQDAFPALTRSRYRGPLGEAPDLRGTYDWHDPATMIHPGAHQTPHIQITTPDKTIIRIEVQP
jgi:hypothetical protein